MSNDHKVAPQAPANNAATQPAKSTTEAKPIVTPVPATASATNPKKA
jgi:hypothetical protein